MLNLEDVSRSYKSRVSCGDDSYGYSSKEKTPVSGKLPRAKPGQKSVELRVSYSSGEDGDVKLVQE